MKTLLITLLLAGCAGEPFTGDDYAEIGNAPIAGKGSESGSGGGGSGLSGSETGGSQSGSGLASAGAMQGGMGTETAGASAGGTVSLAGRTAMGEGRKTPAECLAHWQALDCARVCTNSASDCQAVIDCFVRNNSASVDNCLEFTNIGISLAESAERACCNDD